MIVCIWLKTRDCLVIISYILFEVIEPKNKIYNADNQTFISTAADIEDCSTRQALLVTLDAPVSSI